MRASLTELWLCARILAFAACLPLLLRCLSLPQLLRLITPIPRRRPVRQADASSALRLAGRTDAILGCRCWVLRPNCLRRALVLYHFLRRAGLEVQLCLGVRLRPSMPDDKLEGHAWLVYEGAPFLEPQAALIRRYTVTYRFPAAGQGLPPRWTAA